MRVALPPVSTVATATYVHVDAVMPVRCGAVRVHSVGWFGGGNAVRAWAVRCGRDVNIEEGEVGIGMGWR